MSVSLHPAASHHLPPFITAPGETDILLVVMGVILAASVLGFGILFLRLHTLPERIAHKGHKLQFEIVAVLGLLALFTHMHIFWVAGLLLALIDFPDIGGWLARIAGSVEKIAGIETDQGAAEHGTVDPKEGMITPAEPPGKHESAARHETKTRSVKHDELSHA
jgi:hypothetical protein